MDSTTEAEVLALRAQAHELVDMASPAALREAIDALRQPAADTQSAEATACSCKWLALAWALATKQVLLAAALALVKRRGYGQTQAAAIREGFLTEGGARGAARAYAAIGQEEEGLARGARRCLRDLIAVRSILAVGNDRETLSRHFQVLFEEFALENVKSVMLNALYQRGLRTSTARKNKKKRPAKAKKVVRDGDYEMTEAEEQADVEEMQRFADYAFAGGSETHAKHTAG